VNLPQDDDRHLRKNLVFDIARSGDVVFGQHGAGGEPDGNRNQADRGVEETGHHRTRYRDFLIPARQRTLDEVLTDHAAEPHDDPAPDIVNPIGVGERHRISGGVSRGANPQRKILGREATRHGVPAARLEYRPGNDDEEPDHDQRNLNHVGERHRPHAAGEGVDKNHTGADESAVIFVDPGQDVKNGADAEHLRTEPADVDGDHPKRGVDARPFPVFTLDDIGDGETFQAAEQPDDENTGEDQADRSAEGVGEHSADAVLIDGGGHAHARPGAEPGGQQRRGGHPQGKTPPGNQKVVHALNLAARPETDSDHHEDVQGDPDPECQLGIGSENCART